MQELSNPPPQQPERQPEDEKRRTIWKATVSQLGLQIQLVDGSKYTWPYGHLCRHTLRGGKLTIWFSEHVVTIRGRHLEEADEGLRLQSLVGLRENGTLRKDKLGEHDIPEDQPAIDSIHIEEREKQ